MPLNEAQLAFAAWQAEEEKARQKAVVTARRYHDGLQDTFMTERMKTLLASTEYAVPYPKHWRLIELFRPFATSLEKCYRGELAAADAMAEACAEIDKILQEDA